MANALNREIQAGEQVVVRASLVESEYGEFGRRFVCIDGFGMHSYTLGTAIFGYWRDTGPSATDSISGMWIDAEETERLSLG